MDSNHLKGTNLVQIAYKATLTTKSRVREGVFWARVSDDDNLRFSSGDPSFNTTFLVVPKRSKVV